MVNACFSRAETRETAVSRDPTVRDASKIKNASRWSGPRLANQVGSEKQGAQSAPAPVRKARSCLERAAFHDMASLCIGSSGIIRSWLILCILLAFSSIISITITAIAGTVRRMMTRSFHSDILDA
jgi:hypothetical protein